MVHPAIRVADRPRKMKKYNEDNRAVRVTKKEFDLDNSRVTTATRDEDHLTSYDCSLKQAPHGDAFKN